MGGEAPVTLDGVGFNKNRLQSLYLFHNYRGNKEMTSKFLKKSDFMKINQRKKVDDIFPLISTSP
jgi:hypothetical protein